MKTFFQKFKTSIALDRNRESGRECELGEGQPRQESLRALDDRLRESRAGDSVPAGLHGSVMWAVRASTRRSEPVPAAIWWPRFAAAVGVLIIGAGVFWSLSRPIKLPETVSSTEAPPSLAAAMEQGHALTQSAPEAALRPLSGELDLLSGDIQNAVNFVVASVP